MAYGKAHALTVISHGSYSNKEIKFQYIPRLIELNFQDISDAYVHSNKCSDQYALKYLFAIDTKY